MQSILVYHTIITETCNQSKYMTQLSLKHAINLSISHNICVDFTALLDHPLCECGQQLFCILRHLQLGDNPNLSGAIRRQWRHLNSWVMKYIICTWSTYNAPFDPWAPCNYESLRGLLKRAYHIHQLELDLVLFICVDLISTLHTFRCSDSNVAGCPSGKIRRRHAIASSITRLAADSLFDNMSRFNTWLWVSSLKE